MSISSVKTGEVGTSLLAGNSFFDPAATWLIQRVNGTGSSATITFSNIPQTYQHLQIRLLARTTSNYQRDTVFVRFNGDSASSYPWHRIQADGSSATAYGTTTNNYIQTTNIPANTLGANIMGAGIIDIHDYASTTKNKTLRHIGGNDSNGAGYLLLTSGLWMSTSAITSITLLTDGNFTTSSTFALYGYKGA